MKFEGIGDDDIVISGIGCKLPETENLPEFAEKLLQGLNLVTKDEKKATPVFFDTLPEYSGKVKNFKKFDNTFFGISQIVTLSMDPMTRHILERTFEAVIDAGINPADLKGTNTAVYTASSFSEFDLAWFADYRGGYGIMGRNRCMNANRVSYWLDVKGTSVALDGSFANGILNIVNGCESIRKDRCDIALISTANFQAIPESAIQMNDLNKLSEDGMCKSYDDSADGSNRSDAVVVFVLQKAKHAKRCYAIIADAFAKCYGSSEEAIHKPVQMHWEMMLNEFYARSNINVNDVYYVEGQGTGVKEEDAAELNAINNVFCKNRKEPLLVGSVNTNIGFTEAAAGACGILKAIVSFEKGIIPKNLHYTTPNSLSKGLTDGKIKIVDKNTPIPSNKLIAINAHGIGGVYAHLVLKANPNVNKPKYDGIPRLVLLSARTDQFMDEILDKVEATPNDVEFVGLLHDLHTKHIDKYLSRGYTVLPKVNDTSIREHQVYGQEKHPVWFIFSGMGSQWAKMGKRLMDLPLFRESVEKSHKILLGKGLDLINIITTDDPKIFDNILHSFVGIAAIQIALVDILNVLGIVPDKMIGHSVGELGCSYADGCLTAEQTILCAYSRGKASIETELIKGFMAAIGKGYNQIKDELPEGIEVACHNAADSCTLSGPADLVKKYVEELQERKIFARTVNVANIAYHSQYIKPAAPKLLQYLQEVIPEPKLRSSKWISTSNLEENWDTDLAKYCSAEYHTNNLLSSVYFEEGSKHIPKDAVCIEIAPHGLLQAILKRSLEETCINIPLTNRSADDPLNFFLQAVGKMYLAGLNPEVHKLYPKIEYPVSKNTPSLHQLVHWQHDNDIIVFQYASEKKSKYSLKDPFLKTASDGIGYLINDKNYYPSSVFIHLIWVIFASSLKRKLNDCPVVFEEIMIEKLVPVQDSESDDVEIFVAQGSGKFEISTDRVIVKGKVSLLDVKEEKELPKNTNAVSLSKNEIYKEFKRRGYDIGNDLKNLESIEAKNEEWRCKIAHSADWQQTLESIIQLQILEKGKDSQSLLVPISIEKLILDPALHSKYCDTVQELEVEYQSVINYAKCGGIEMKGLKLKEMQETASSLKFESVHFAPFLKPVFRDFWTYVDYCFGIITDNCGDMEINVIQITNGIRVPPIASHLEKKFSHLKLKAVTDVGGGKNGFKHDLVVCDSSALKEAFSIISNNGFVFVKSAVGTEKALPDNIDVISKISWNNEDFTLLKKKEIVYEEANYIMIPNNEALLKDALKHLDSSKRITYLIGYKDPEGGLENYRKKFQKETSAQLRWLLILDEKAPKFDPKSSFYAQQLRKGLTTNIYSNNSWGRFQQRIFIENDFDIHASLPKSTRDLTPNYVGVDIGQDLILDDQVEYSGTLKTGEQVMGVASLQKHKNKLVPDDKLIWKIPKSWSLEEAATVPISYALAYYCIKIIASSRLVDFKEQRVLVTDGMSYNGRAAIAVALAFNSSVYVTVSDEQEIPILRKIFPALKESNILCHYDNDIEVEWGFLTKGTYFNLIMNNVEEENFAPSTKCMRSFGKFFHFGKKDLKKNVKLGMIVFMTNTSFYVVSPNSLDDLTNDEKEEIRDFISKGIVDGFVKPLPSVVYNSKEIENLVAAKRLGGNRTKTLLTSEFFETDSHRLKISPDNSYVIFGDATGLWVDIAKWLIRRRVTNIIINCRSGNPKDSSGEIEILKNYRNVIIRQDPDISRTMIEARKLGPIAAVFFVRMSEPNGVKLFGELDKLYRDEMGHLVVISKRKDSISDVCTSRTFQRYPSTNFIWETEEILTNRSLNFIENLSGQDSVIQVTDVKKDSKSNGNAAQMLKKILPPTIEEFCSLGSSLENEIKLFELPTLGQKNSEVKNISPLIIIPGLDGNSANVLAPLCKKLMYPCIAVKFPNEAQGSVRELASMLLPKILSVKKCGNAYNILGLSWGSYVAIEVARLIEEAGGTVGLMLIDGPLRPLQETLLTNKSLEYDLLKVIQEISAMPLEPSMPDSFIVKIDQIVSRLNLPTEEKIYFKEAVLYIYNKLQAMLNYDYSNIKLKGPVTIFKSEGKFYDSVFIKVCNHISVHHVEENHREISNSKQIINIIHGSAITGLMSDNTIHLQSLKEFEEFLLQEKLNKKNNDIILEEMAKTNKQIQIFGFLNTSQAEKSDDYAENYEIAL